MGEIHVCRGTGRFFMARAKWPKYQRMNWTGPKRRTEKKALQDMVREWDRQTYIPYNYADVVMCADYYEPVVVSALRRK